MREREREADRGGAGLQLALGSIQSNPSIQFNSSILGSNPNFSHFLLFLSTSASLSDEQDSRQQICFTHTFLQSVSLTLASQLQRKKKKEEEKKASFLPSFLPSSVFCLLLYSLLFLSHDPSIHLHLTFSSSKHSPWLKNQKSFIH